MKKQTKHSIKAHLLWSALILLSLVAICAIPFALAQRNATKRSAAKPNSVLTPTATGSHAARLAGPLQQSSRVTSGPTGVSAVRSLRMPTFPQVVLYDQYDNDLNNGIVSANRTDNPPLSAEAADNFVVPGGETWNVTEVDIRSAPGFPAPTSFAVTFYLDDGSGLPGTQVYTASGLAVTGDPDYIITLTSPAVLGSGTYWVSAVGTITGSNWYWEGRSITNNTYSTAWRNPLNGYGTGCTDWSRLGPCIGLTWPDQMFRIVGTIGGGLPCTPGWSAGGPINVGVGGVRSVGVYFPANGKFYAMGGRSSDSAGSDFTNPFEYDTTANTWTTKAATYTDNSVNNMACGVLNLSGTDYIYCVGGSAAGATTATARVFYYDPVADSLTYLTSGDDWPGDLAGTILPGGFAVHGNKLYILGGFDILVASTNQIWEFDPTAAVGSKWTQKVNTPMGVMYAPTCTIGNIIYLAGASDFSGGLVIDTTNSFSFDPVANTIGSIAPIPRATGETRALTFKNPPQMWVMGGGRVAPNPSSEVDVYDPVSDSWSLGPAFTTARRNYATDTNGTDHIWLAGGYAPTSPTDSTEVFCQQGGSPTPTPTATPTATAGPCTFQVLIVSSDVGVQPVTLHDQIAAEPGVTAVDYFDAEFATPTLGQLQPYNIVVAFSNSPYADPIAMGDVLADYADTGGIVVAFNFDWYGPPFGLDGRWMTC